MLEDIELKEELLDPSPTSNTFRSDLNRSSWRWFFIKYLLITTEIAILIGVYYAFNHYNDEADQLSNLCLDLPKNETGTCQPGIKRSQNIAATFFYLGGMSFFGLFGAAYRAHKIQKEIEREMKGEHSDSESSLSSYSSSLAQPTSHD